jgi:signal transduction histidine kinase
LGVPATTSNLAGIQMITEQVEEIARCLLLRSPLGDPRELSLALAGELARREILDSDESAQSTDLSSLISDLCRGLPAPLNIDVAISGDILKFFINKARAEALFASLLRNCAFAGARKVQIQCLNLLERWEFSLWDDGNSLSPIERSALLDNAYEVSEAGELQVGDVSLFIAKQIVQFYEGDISVSSGPDGGNQITFSIPKE